MRTIESNPFLPIGSIERMWFASRRGTCSMRQRPASCSRLRRFRTWSGRRREHETAEPHASPEPNPACVQSFTYTFAIDYDPTAEHRIPKPPSYDRIRDSQPFGLRMNYPTEYGWRGTFTYSVFGEDPPIPNNMSPKPFFPWRRLVAHKNLRERIAPQDLALMNWPRQDYHDESLLDRTPEDTARILQAAKNVSFSFLYWLQNDVPRDDGKGTGYPGFRLRKEVMESRMGCRSIRTSVNRGESAWKGRVTRAGPEH